MRPARTRAVGLLCLMATSGCAGMSRNEKSTVLGITGIGSIAGGVLLLNARTGCSGNSEDPNACTFGDQGQDFAVTLGSGALIVGGGAFLVAAGYLLTR